MRNNEERLDDLDEQEKLGKISRDEAIIKRDILINDIARKCDFCITPKDDYCVCYGNKGFKIKY